MFAQTITLKEAEGFADALVKKDILNKKGKETLLKEIAAKRVETEHRSTVNEVSYVNGELNKETILQFCASAFRAEQLNRLSKGKIEDAIVKEDAIGHRTYTFDFMSGMGAKHPGCISAKRSTIGFTRTRTLEDFKATGLINDKVYEDCKQALLDSSVLDEVELTEMMLKRSIYYHYYDFNVNEQKQFAQKLFDKGILTETGKEQLFQSYQPYQLKSIPEILSFSPRFVWVDLSAYVPDPTVTYPVVFKAIQQLLPEFQYNDLQIAIIEKKESDLIQQDVHLSFKADGYTYAHVFFHDFKREVPDTTRPELIPSRIDQDFHKAVNKWLTDKESPFRLYTVNTPEPGEDVYGGKKMGLILLKEGEAEVISKNPYLLSRESFDNRLSRRNIEKLISNLKQQGLFAHLTDAELETAKQTIATSEIGSLEDVLLQFPKTIVFFDWETGNRENPYESLTKQFAEASRGAFIVTNITDEFKKGWKSKVKKVKYGFTLNGRRYETLLSFEDDWLAPEFLEMLRKALMENKVDGAIYYCVDNGQEAGYIFLSSSQAHFIKTNYPDLLKE